MKISVFGLGYVGCVSAACFADQGHHVIGVDINKDKISIINQGRCPIVEEGMDALIKKVVKKKRLVATNNVKEAILKTEITFICVGTPSRPNGNLNYDIIERSCSDIGTGLKEKKDKHIVVIRSTILPGCINSIVIPALERSSGKKEGKDFFVCVNPEFLREGTSLKDYYDPPFILVGVGQNKKGSKELKAAYKGIKTQFIETSIEVSEMIKYTCNAFHALKITFANEIGSICKAIDVDGHKVMDIVCRDKKLNISERYMMPGFAFGGSCLPKDLRAMTYKAKEEDLNVPLLNSLLPSNSVHFSRAVDFILSLNKKKIGMLGLSFKEGTDDLRESPNVALVETLIGKGFDISIYDENVLLARLFGANKDFIEKQIPHISRLLKPSLEEVIENSDILVIGNRSINTEALRKNITKEQVVYDLVRLLDDPSAIKGTYCGVCW